MKDNWGNQWDKCRPLSENDLAAAEARTKQAFPHELRTLFLSCNGGRPKLTYFSNGKIEVEIGALLPISPPASFKGTSFDAARLHLAKTGRPPGFLPFALDNGNDGILCLDVASGAIVYCVDDDDPSDLNKPVAASLTELLSRLQEPPY